MQNNTCKNITAIFKYKLFTVNPDPCNGKNIVATDSASIDTLLCKFVNIEVGMTYDCLRSFNRIVNSGT